jgi:peptidyl-prolyl cis-trans isomerase B (cyclophilin B)
VTSTVVSTPATGAPATVSAAEAAIPTPGCRHVPRPPSRAGEPASKPTETLNPNHSYTVLLQTNCGPIVIELAVQEAPETASSFAHLVQIGYYDDLTFHRIVPGFVIQGGDPNGNGTGGPSWQIVEPPPANLRYVKGTVAMAKSPSAPSGASGSQFFIVVGSHVNLPPVYALVGHVISGMKSVEAIAAVPTEVPPEGGEDSRPRVPVVIEKATLTTH